MAATYVPTQLTAKDRVRRMMGDVAAPFRFQDEEIAFQLTKSGFVGDPLATLPEQELPELTAAVLLLESLPGAAGDELTVKQGSVTRTVKGGTGDFVAILGTLRRRLDAINGANLGIGAGIYVVEPYYAGLDPCRGYPGYGD